LAAAAVQIQSKQFRTKRFNRELSHEGRLLSPCTVLFGLLTVTEYLAKNVAI
jgi:hypothetical protein